MTGGLQPHRWLRVDGRAVLVVVRLAADEAPGAAAVAAEVADDLRAHYGPVLDGCSVRSWSDVNAGVLVLVVQPAGIDAEAGAGDGLALPLLWGVPVGAHGEATDGELAAALRDPQAAAGLLGSAVLVGLVEAGLRLVTGPDLVHTLARVDGPRRTAWATKGWAALLAAQVRPRLALERVPEYVLFDQVWGDDELLADVRLEAEALCCDVSPDRVASSSWWPVADRMGPGASSTPEQLREVLVAELGRVGRVPGLQLALTAGRDSTLVALCLSMAGCRPAAYTFGGAGSLDCDGAARTAQALGLPHLPVQSGQAPGRSFAAAVLASGWTEGLDTAWNLLGPPLAWPKGGPAVHLSGSGGETGRAFYYGDRSVPDSVDGCVDLLTERASGLAPAAQQLIRERLTAAVTAGWQVAGSGPRTLDVLYARTRMRSWLNRTLPAPQVRSVVAAYTSPAVVRALLDLPEASRRTGRGFDAALGERGRELHQRAQARPTAPWQVRGVTALIGLVEQQQGRVRGAHRITRTLQTATGRTDTVGVRALHRALADLPDGPVVTRQMLGAPWWSRVLDAAPYDGDARRLLWNALAVEALAQRLD